MVALHKATEKPTGYPVNRSLMRPSGAAHQAACLRLLALYGLDGQTP